MNQKITISVEEASEIVGISLELLKKMLIQGIVPFVHAVPTKISGGKQGINTSFTPCACMLI